MTIISMLNSIVFAFDGFLLFAVFGATIAMVLYFFRGSFTMDDGKEISKKPDESSKYMPFFKIDIIGNRVYTLVILGFAAFFVVLYAVIFVVGSLWAWLFS
ncbi:MAG: hypothetical protein PHE67_13560 [Campylobacterales bacterium]|nr:hypothetical protein [Campylobacterales bacterium]